MFQEDCNDAQLWKRKKIQSIGNIAWAERRKTGSNSKKLVLKNMTGFSSKTLQFSKID